MAIGPIGETGIYVVSRALVEPRADLELALIPRHEMEAVNAAERAKTYSLAMKIHAQVKKFIFCFARCKYKGSINFFSRS